MITEVLFLGGDSEPEDPGKLLAAWPFGLIAGLRPGDGPENNVL